MNEINTLQSLNVGENILSLLKENKIKSTKQLCAKTKSELRNMGLTNSEINRINVELQLLGERLKGSL